MTETTTTTLREKFARWTQLRADSFFNLLTGLSGGEGPDGLGGALASKLAFGFAPNARLDDTTLEEMYHANWLVARVCDLVPDECLRQGFELTTEGDGDPDAVARMGAWLEAMHVRAKLAEAWAWARLYGGGALLLGVDDEREMTEPLDETTIKSFRFVTVLDRRECFPHRLYRDALRPEFGNPETFRIARVTPGGTANVEVHESRLVRFHGVRTSRRKKIANSSWGQGVVQRVWDDIRQYQGAWVAAATLLQDASQGVFAIKNLEALIAADRDDALKTRLQAMDMARSVGRSILIDAESERFERVEANILGGVPAVLDRFMSNLSAATQIPVPILFGEAPAGLNATADNTVRQFYDSLKAVQVNELQPKLQRIVTLLWRAKDGPTRGVEPPNWAIKFRPLWQATEEETADVRLKTAQADQIYLATQVLTPEEVAISRFRAEGFSPETIVDLAVRQAALAADQQPEPKPAPTPAEPQPAPASNGAPA